MVYLFVYKSATFFQSSSLPTYLPTHLPAFLSSGQPTFVPIWLANWPPIAFHLPPWLSPLHSWPLHSNIKSHIIESEKYEGRVHFLVVVVPSFRLIKAYFANFPLSLSFPPLLLSFFLSLSFYLFAATQFVR